jgi:hypothetical protein
LISMNGPCIKYLYKETKGFINNQTALPCRGQFIYKPKEQVADWLSIKSKGGNVPIK